MDISQLKELLQDTLEWPRTKPQKLLAGALNSLEPGLFDEVVNQLLDKISREEVKSFGLMHFEDIDRYPNPRDGLLSRDEITESLERAGTAKEKAILLWIWMNFDEIRQSSDDFQGADKPFDIVLTLKDFEKFQF